MAEQMEYAVYRFLEQNGYCHMVSDYVKGRTLMQVVKEGVPADRTCFWDWCVQLAGQLERYYKWEDGKAYGYVNPCAAVVTEGQELLLLDVLDGDNAALVERMGRKKLRALFVRRDRILTRNASQADDLYGLGRTLQFLADRCPLGEPLGMREKKALYRLAARCLDGTYTGIKGLRELQKALRLLGKERPRLGKEGLVRGEAAGSDLGSTWERNRRTAALAAAAALVMLAAGATVVRGRAEAGRETGEPQRTAAALESAEKSGEKNGKEAGAKTDGAAEATAGRAAELAGEDKVSGRGDERQSALGAQADPTVHAAYLAGELGLLYCEEEDYERGLACLEEAAEELPLAEAYLTMEKYRQEGGAPGQTARELEQALELAAGELEKEELQDWIQGKMYLYHMPLLSSYGMLDTSEAWEQARTIGEKMEEEQCWGDGPDCRRREQEVRGYLGKAYETLEQPEKAVREYERLKELEDETAGQEEIYLKLADLYDGMEDREKGWDVLREAAERLPRSERIWLAYLERQLRDGAVERTVCGETVKKAVQAAPGLLENAEFQKLQTQYEIKIEGGEVWVGK